MSAAKLLGYTIKSLPVVFLLFCFAFRSLLADETNLTLTVDGITYSNVTFGTVTPSHVSIMHSTGVTSVPLGKLTPELQKRFGYDPAKSVAYLSTVADRQRTLEARAKEERDKAAANAAMKAKRVLVNATVIQALPNGALVRAIRAEPEIEMFENGRKTETYKSLGDIFVVGLTGVYDESRWQGYITPAGDFEYTTVQGAYRKVPQYKVMDK